jgi:hypothetical protein
VRDIFFYPASRNMAPHYDSRGTLHLPMSEWDEVLRRKRKNEPGDWTDRAIIPNYPTNGTMQARQDTQ